MSRIPFLLGFEKKNKDITRITETAVRGAYGAQSFKIPDSVFQKDRNALNS
jgi:hypothetical protein